MGESMVENDRRYVALGARLRSVPEVITLGVRPTFLDYSKEERTLILEASVILFPTINYAQYLFTMGKKIFPSLETHLYADDKIKQTNLFQMLGIPHPRTRIYYPRHWSEILEDFDFPFIAKIPRNSGRGRGVFLIRNKTELESYSHLSKIAYIQEYLSHDRDLRVVLVNYDPILAYWRKVAPGNFRANLAQGAGIDLECIPAEAIALAKDAALRCGFDDVGLDLINCAGRWQLIEANTKYGRKALAACGMDIREITREKLLSGEIADCDRVKVYF
ncbi:MAG: RimK family alpha-L-glutamate ligase [Deltaproteobacteria bacterium CG_4_8_14_3_um_filter_51_11]|nr:MAG: RimK family alpha-L-glutamate ligase [Deltaproteobacteria bacterium CG23_combo_of_CG06-09_8_20_14_all_51_20]PIX18506.1 MAG: RimK family alpha-L-glutamate ligase [Deltaproteobacteria bacterium CG_4_8_14_3_um_filter_51_11]PIY22398.1 MAG: RimK family alpha-L-glutamate ligase [Deltaproteobacteria bacterium CG_4_10_14_3_um_filter_51_14]PJB34850.1 MAG: RimK family alpha-L-glutamate ligase [Deltaproteobacteria bacterium CG_4_9_14_3_um_filter_51_14]